MKVGVLYNPRARANKKSQSWLSFWETQNVDLKILEGPQDLSESVKTFSSKKYDLLFVSGGDGTVQHLQTEFGNLKKGAYIPMLCLLPHGTTNMTASDIGLQEPTKTKIRSILTRKNYIKRATSLKERATIKVDNINNMRPQFGMFFGAGALYEAVKKFHEGKPSQKLTGHLATGKILIREIISALNPTTKGEGKIYRGYEMCAQIENTKITEGQQLFVLVATLDKLILGSQPFWNINTEGLKFTSVAWPLKRNLLSAVYNIMFAHDRSLLAEPEFISRSCNALELNISSSHFTMDGELFEVEPDKALKMSLGPKFKYLCG